jgi:tetratricopeptide (TPR) repeat protein
MELHARVDEIRMQRTGGRNMRRILLGQVLMLLALPAWAQSTDENWSRCGNTDNNVDHVITACTAEIQSGQETTAKLAIAYQTRGFAYAQKSLSDQAIADATKAIALKPDYARAYLDLGNYYFGKGLYKQAIADVSRAIALKPDYGRAYFDRAIIFSRNGLQDPAIADYTKAIALKAQNAPDSYVKLSLNYIIYSSYNGLAWAYHMKGEDAKGLADANKAVALAPTDEGSIETRAEIYEKLGQRARAIADYREALKLNPNDKDAQTGLKRLNP